MTAWSIALRDIPRPDYADALIVAIGPHGSVDPAAWARRMLDPVTMPRWAALVVALGLGTAPRPESAGDIPRPNPVDDEVLLAADGPWIDLRWAIAVDESTRVLRVTTTVRVTGTRGRVRVGILRVLHPLVVRALVRSAARWFERQH